MKKLLIYSSVILLALSCHIKKDPKEVTELLTEYFTNASNEAISIEERKATNQKALKLVLQSDNNKQDSLFFKNIYKIAKAYEYIGDHYEQQTLLDSAYLYYEQAQKYYTSIKDKENTGRMLLFKASVQYHDGELTRSEIFSLEALKSFNDIKDKKQNQKYLYDAYNLLGMLANDQQEYFKALEYHNKAFQIILKDTSINNRAILKSVTLNNLGVVYRNKDENRQALSYFAMALENKDLPEKIPHLYAMLLDNTAYSQFKIKNYTGIQDLFYNALLIRENLNLTSGIVMSKLHMSEYYHRQKDTKKAFRLAQEAYDLAKTKKIDPRDVMRLLKQLQQVNAPSKEAYTILYNRIADSLQQVQPKVHEIITQELAQAKAKEEAEIKKEEIYKILFMGLGVIACFVGLYYIRYRREKRRIKRNVKKQAELQANIREKQVLIQESRACIQEKETEVQEKESQIKIYDLLLHQDSKTKKKRGLERSNVVASLHETIFNRIWSLRLALGTFRTKESQKYVHDLKSLEEDVKKLYDFSTAIIQEEEQTKHDHYVSLLQKLFKIQRKNTALSDYMEVDWSYFDNEFKIHFYKMLEDFFTVIRQNKKQNKKTALVELELYDQEEERGVIVLHIIFNETIACEAFQEKSTNLKKIGGLLKIDHEQDNTKIEVVLSVKTHKIASLA